jgi:hypothetical protein
MGGPPRDRAGSGYADLLVGDRMNGILDTCIVCGRSARRPGAGICRYHEIMALIDLSYDRMLERIRKPQPPRGRRLPISREKLTKGNYEL